MYMSYMLTILTFYHHKIKDSLDANAHRTNIFKKWQTETNSPYYLHVPTPCTKKPPPKPQHILVQI